MRNPKALFFFVLLASAGAVAGPTGIFSWVKDRITRKTLSNYPQFLYTETKSNDTHNIIADGKPAKGLVWLLERVSQTPRNMPQWLKKHLGSQKYRK